MRMNVDKKDGRQSTAINYAIGSRPSKDCDSKVSLFEYSPASFCCVYSNAFGFYLIYYLTIPLVGEKTSIFTLCLFEIAILAVELFESFLHRFIDFLQRISLFESLHVFLENRLQFDKNI